MITQRFKNSVKRVLRFRGILAVTLAFAMIAGMIPGTGTVMTVEATVPPKTISGLGTNGIGSPVPGYLFDSRPGADNSNHDIPWSGSYVYYGTYNNEPVKYRVLDPRTGRFSGNSSVPTMLLDCDNILMDRVYNSTLPQGGQSYVDGALTWQDSSIRAFLNGDDFYGNGDVFTALEKNAIAASNIDEHPYSGYGGPYHTTYTTPGGSTCTVDFHGGIGGNFIFYTPLVNDHVFLLDVEDLCNINYGYTNDLQGDNRVKNPVDGAFAVEYWTRTMCQSNNQRAGYVCGPVDDAVTNYHLGGYVNISYVNGTLGVSPAFNVDLSKVVFSSSISGQDNTHKLTLLDSNIGVTVTEGSVIENDTSYYFTVRCSVTDNSTYDPTRVSYVVTNGTWNDETGWSYGAEVLGYGQLGTSLTGVRSFSVSKTVARGSLGSDFHVYVVPEVENSGSATDYAGAPVELPVIIATADDVQAAYDGEAHGITVNVSVPQSGYTIRYGEDASTYNLDASPTITNVSDSPRTVYYEISASGYVTYRGYAYINLGYGITLDANGGSSETSVITRSNGKLSALPDASRTGYTFDGWYTAAEGGDLITTDTVFDSNQTIYAHWTYIQPVTYSVTVSTEGNGTASADPSTAAQGETVTLSATPDTGYQFKEWQVISGGISVPNNSFTMPAGNVSVKAVFEQIPNQNQGNDDGSDDDNNNQTNPDDQNNNNDNNNNDNNDDNNNTDNNDDVNDDNNNQNNNTDVNDDNNNQNNNTDVNDDNNQNNNDDVNDDNNDDDNNNSDVPPVVARCLMYRLYNPNSGEHFYTGSLEELNNLKTAGWIHEGNGFEVPVISDTPVYRMYNPNAGDHHYTTSADEKKFLEDAGWNYEGIAWYSAPITFKPLYRLNNPNASSGAHHYTMSEEERDHLTSIGWKYEGIGWFGY